MDSGNYQLSPKVHMFISRYTLAKIKADEMEYPPFASDIFNAVVWNAMLWMSEDTFQFATDLITYAKRNPNCAWVTSDEDEDIMYMFPDVDKALASLDKVVKEHTGPGGHLAGHIEKNWYAKVYLVCHL